MVKPSETNRIGFLYSGKVSTVNKFNSTSLYYYKKSEMYQRAESSRLRLSERIWVHLRVVLYVPAVYTHIHILQDTHIHTHITKRTK